MHEEVLHWTLILSPKFSFALNFVSKGVDEITQIFFNCETKLKLYNCEVQVLTTWPGMSPQTFCFTKILFQLQQPFIRNNNQQFFTSWCRKHYILKSTTCHTSCSGQYQTKYSIHTTSGTGQALTRQRTVHTTV